MNFSTKGFPKNQRSFDQFEATALYCPKCQEAVPLKKRLLLVLPEGDKYEYLCVYCGTTVGDKTEKEAKADFLLIP